MKHKNKTTVAQKPSIVKGCVGKLIVSNYIAVSINDWLLDMLGT